MSGRPCPACAACSCPPDVPEGAFFYALVEVHLSGSLEHATVRLCPEHRARFLSFVQLADAWLAGVEELARPAN